MEFNIEVRKNQLENLDQFISNSRNRVQAILATFKWSTDKVMKETNLVSCPIDSNHRMSSKKLQSHISECSIKCEGYDMKEAFLSIPTHNPGQYILIDNKTKGELFTKAESEGTFKRAWNGRDPEPRTANRLLCTYSNDERLAMYDYAVSKTVGPPALPEFDVTTTITDGKDKKDLTNEELLALERDAKRRRIKYKSIYTNHKSHTEVIKEVIDGQMDVYEGWLKNKNVSKDQRIPSPCTSQTSVEKDLNERSTISRNSMRSGGSRERSRKLDHCTNGTQKESRKERRSDLASRNRDGRRRSRSRHSSQRHSKDRRYKRKTESGDRKNGYRS